MPECATAARISAFSDACKHTVVSWPSLSQVVQQLLVTRGLLPDNSDSGQLAVSLRVQAATLPDLRCVNCLFQFFSALGPCVWLSWCLSVSLALSVPVHMFLCACLSSSVAYLTVFVCVSVHLSVSRSLYLSLSVALCAVCERRAHNLPSVCPLIFSSVCFSRSHICISVSLSGCLTVLSIL